jgi:DNA polymerase-3 subunit alpha
MGSTEKVVEYIEECKRLTMPDGQRGVKVLPPDVNVSDKDFTPVYVEEEEKVGRKKVIKNRGVIRFGLCAVRGVGEKAVEAIIKERQDKGTFNSIYDFTERVDLRMVTRSTVEALVKCGAFSSISEKRAPLLQVLESAIEMGQQSQNDKRSGQMNMFAAATQAAAPSAARAMGSSLPDIDELQSAELLKFEKELLGFYITSHPLTEHQVAMDAYTTATTREAMNLAEGTEVTIGGMISRVKKVITKNGRSAGMPMGIITLEDLEGQIDGTMFAETFADITAKFPNAVANESIVFVKGKVDKKRETPSLLINEVLPISEAIPRLTTNVALKLDPAKHNDDVMKGMKELLAKHKGNLRVFAQIVTNEGQKVTMSMPKELSVRPSIALQEDIDQLLGSGTLLLLGEGARRLKRLRQQQLFKQEATPETTTTTEMQSDESVAAAMDEEMLQEA